MFFFGPRLRRVGAEGCFKIRRTWDRKDPTDEGFWGGKNRAATWLRLFTDRMTLERAAKKLKGTRDS